MSADQPWRPEGALDPRPRALFLSPIVPAPDRNGLAMRAGVTVEGLDRHFDLTVAVVRLPDNAADLSWLREHAATVLDLPLVADLEGAKSWIYTERGRRLAASPLPALARTRPPSIGTRIAREVGTGFDALVVMGTYLAGAALPLLDAGIPGVLDADNDDAKLCASLSKIDPSYASEVPLYEHFQSEVFPWFDQVAFASLDDAVSPFVHLPNAVKIPTQRSTRLLDGPLRLLFVGMDGYPPNRDAHERLRRTIVPAIQGLGIDTELLRPGPEDDVSSFYRQADIAVAPLRAGAGTRIKLLEAFAYGCPAVATPTGASGLGIRPGVELVVTHDDDDDAAFAEAVVELASDGDHRNRIAGAARTFVEQHHDQRVVSDRLAQIVHRVVAAG